MDDRGRVRIVSGIDVIIAIFIIIIGILVVIVGAGYLDTLTKQAEQYASYGYSALEIPLYSWASVWFVIMLGITTIIYGIKRIIDDIFKITRLNQPSIRKQPPAPKPTYTPQTQQQVQKPPEQINY